MYTFQEFYLPEHMQESLDAYIQRGRSVGDFLTAVISNNLTEAVGRADEKNLKNLPAFVAYLYNEAPSACWGSREKMKAWLAKENENAKTK